MNTETSDYPQRVPSRRPSRPLFNASGSAQRLRASPLFAIGPSAPGPALRRGFLLAVPIAITLVFELGFDTASPGRSRSAPSICGFPGMDAPAGRGPPGRPWRRY